ncbi:MAG: PilZ domain-containing protein [Deltaproteobacteria bacterium]|nr:PilZ domain-containing protein [Deltaproteobacteria bacterium]
MPTIENSGHERRASPRFPLQVSVRLSGRRFFVTYEGDVSEGGVFLTTAIPISRGERVELKFTLPGGTEVTAEGIVQNQRPEEVGLGVGVKFSRIDARFVKAIAGCLKKAKQ